MSRGDSIKAIPLHKGSRRRYIRGIPAEDDLLKGTLKKRRKLRGGGVSKTRGASVREGGSEEGTGGVGEETGGAGEGTGGAGKGTGGSGVGPGRGGEGMKGAGEGGE
ncbi:hypothetical protein Pcinc_005868 [Petrolisthes cinctipes]|uniref:Uncharacterized protein n=1 Tax=Petrolisthes cinctipes TaxID=88211 RepID=A0AAE1GE06_PETCI|nr:hypothetical protein Pcinc_005868 [Petrolisthes cinctipes]